MRKSGWFASSRYVVTLMVIELWIRRACGSQIRMHQREFLSTIRLCLNSNSHNSDVAEGSDYAATSGTPIQNISSGVNLPKTASVGNGANSLTDSMNSAATTTNKDGFFLGLCDFDCNFLHKDIVEDKERLLSVAGGLGISYFVVPGSNLESSKAILDFTEERGRISLIGSAGVHPYNAASDFFCKDTADQLTSMISRSNCYAVGECGLDYSDGFPDREKQKEWFR